MKSFVLPVALSLSALVLGSACSRSGEPAATVSAPDAKAAAPAAVAGKPAPALPKLGAAPQWKLQDLAGKPVSAADFKGKVVVVDFWATWCPPCREEVPGYVELQNKYGKDGLVIVGVSLDQAGPEVVKAFATKFGVNYPMLMGDEAVVSAFAPFGGVQALPTTFLIDAQGQIRDRKVGMETKEVYEKKIVAVLGEKA
jgi:thiol-disulfide isomerase/thioredoxin